MDIGKLRLLLRKYLSSRLRIDKWGLSLPDSIESKDKPTSIGLDKPALDININEEESSGWGKQKISLIEATIPFQVIYRFSSLLNYETIPRASAEAKLNEILVDASNCSCIDERLESVSASGSVSVAETKNGDFLLLFEVDFVVSFYYELDIAKSIFSP